MYPVHSAKHLSGCAKVILVVDDDADTIALVRSIGRKAGYRVLGAAGGKACLSMLQQTAPQLILLDMNMPGLDGLATCRRVRSDLNAAHIPIALLTARKTVEDVKRGMDAGADHFIVKPFDPLHLLERIGFMMSRSSLLSARRIRRLSTLGPPEDR